MVFSRVSIAAAGVAAMLAVSACGGNPPDKEIQQAQGAIDTARAAGASNYSPDEFAAAEGALAKANAAVGQHDYRQALSFALDARDRAQTAVKDAVDRKATARADADRALRDADQALHGAGQKLKSLEGNRAMARAVASVRPMIDASEEGVKKARAAFDAGNYRDVPPQAKAVIERLRVAVHDLEAPPPAPARSRRR